MTGKNGKITNDLDSSNIKNIVFFDSISFGNDSVLISEATYCANDQGKYSKYQEILFDSQQEIDNWAQSEQLKKFAIDLELDVESFDECQDSRKYQNKVLSNIDYAKNLGVDKIPVFKIINTEGLEHILKGGLSSNVFEVIAQQFQ